MRYNEEKDAFYLSVRELVSTARRKIASTPQKDENEPSYYSISDSLIKRLIPKRDAQAFDYEFATSEHKFILNVFAQKIDANTLTLLFSTDTNPERPKKELINEARGEGFVTALAYMKTHNVSLATVEYVYFNPQSEESFTVSEAVSEKKANDFFKKCIEAIEIYALPEMERVKLRLPTMRNLRFPYKDIRDGQLEFINTAYKTISKHGIMLGAAPTGTGKTVSALYPAIRALGDGRCEKVFYLTPKTTTAKAAAECLCDMADEGAIIRSVILSAKERTCKNGLICRESRGACENSENNRIADATLALYNKAYTVAGLEQIYSVAKEYKVCPHELSLSYSELADVVICDINYLFDPKSYIRRHFDEPGLYAFLIDEAHNLPDRAREMYSAEISDSELLSCESNDVLGEHSDVKNFARVASEAFIDVLLPYVKEEIREDSDGALVGATHLSQIPTPLYSLFEELLRKAEGEIFMNMRSGDSERDARLSVLKDYYYKALYFYQAMLRFDSHYELFIFSTNGKIRTKIFCVDPAGEIKKRVELGASAVFFSATLSPLSYYRYALGADATASVIEVESPFDPSQLSVSIMDKISTRYSEREDTLFAVTRAIAAAVSAKRGNYMVFSPSFAYSDALAKAFKAKYPKIKVLVQEKNMSAKEKDEFISEFKKESQSYLIGFCVMGGIYAEGIDLAGDSLIGAIVVGVGIPQISYEREAISAYYDERFDEGKAYAYIYPGMNRVLQAAGRVIRREDDRGVIVLIDDRFDDPIYKKAIPNLWSNMKFIATPKELNEELAEFWKEV